jgi:hypothetical protein
MIQLYIIKLLEKANQLHQVKVMLWICKFEINDESVALLQENIREYLEA